MGKYLLGQLKSIFTKNLLNKLSYLVVKNDISTLKNAFNASTYGGAPLLGLKKPVIKAHGNSKANDIVSAVEQAIKFVESGIIDKVSKQIN
jgi:glycerol-3-phosphate acyltransferase PlsX